MPYQPALLDWLTGAPLLLGPVTLLNSYYEPQPPTPLALHMHEYCHPYRTHFQTILVLPPMLSACPLVLLRLDLRSCLASSVYR